MPTTTTPTTLATGEDRVTLTLSRASFRSIIDAAVALNDRRDELLDLNGEGELDEAGRAELNSLVRIAQICMMLEMAAEYGDRK